MAATDAGNAATPHRPVRRGDKVSEAIARDIVRRIGAEGMAPGTQLPPEAKMLEEYRVGRGSLREALRILEVHGLISIKPGPRGGPTVDQVHTRNFGRMASLYFQMEGMTFRELLEARSIMEPMLARAAAERHEPGLADELARFDGVVRGEDEYLRLAGDFHELVAVLSGNRILALFGQSLADVLRDRLHDALFPKSRRREILGVHSDIGRAIVAGDGDLAERLMRAHMEDYVAQVKRRHPGLVQEVVDWR
ncbi:FadR/GntR family transcriptional regulator [Actinophytocola gossypii]|uniref:FadR family transcriptional regulator n=1 Tax=Actinophytocola gossypii TaxID=2812003 RepID=A0ABT2JA99_9PSEU|nr:FCD domain-containing protein [Actinophytocola gossypii]MCT2584214.1 FadR family transcriptional regulator [Actinophytocola gossypii]